MIIIGKSRGGAQKLGRYLNSEGKNERVQVVEIRGTVAEDVPGAINEMAALGAGTQCEKPLYHAMINPEPPHRLSPDQQLEAVDALEHELGLTGHPRVVVLHEKGGRQHLHVTWSRIDLGRMCAVSDSHNYRKHELVARDLERRFGHERVQGAHVERDGVERPERTPSRAEWEQTKRTGINGKAVKEEVTRAFRNSDGPEAFRAALEEKGYVLAHGDRRDYIVVDRAGGIHSLARRLDGVTTAQLREFMKPIDPASVPTADEAREIASDRARRQKELNSSHEEASIEKAYGRGDDYVSQSQAAMKDHKRRQEILDDYSRENRQGREQQEEEGQSRKNSAHPGANAETTGNKQDRIDRLLNTVEENDRQYDREGRPPGHQPEASGGGRTRSQ